jgi:acid phosphatase type 7
LKILSRMILAVFIALSAAAPRCFAAGEKIVIYGDTRTNHEAHRKIVSAILKVKPFVVFHLGDMVNDGNNKKEWDIFEEIIAPLRKIARIFPLLGNHEAGSELYFRHFGVTEGARWYSLDLDNIHFTVLDSTSDLDEGSPQYKWLRSDLENHENAELFKLVLLHHPVFSVGRHRDTMELSRTLEPLFEKYRVDAVFSGHDHNYQRFLVNNIHYIVTSGGGAPLYSQESKSPYLEKFIKEYHFCVISVKDNVLLVQAFDPGLKLIDQFQIPARVHSRLEAVHN